MGPLPHLLTAAVLAVVLRWLWNSSTIEQSRLEAGRQLFPPTRPMCALTLSGGVVFTELFVWSQLTLRQPADWWVPDLFLGCLTLGFVAYPPVCSIQLDR